MENTKSDWKAYEAAHPITVPPDLRNPHPIIVQTAKHRQRELEGKAQTASTRRSGIFRIDVREANIERALRIADTFLKACEARGFLLRRQNDGDSNAVAIVLGEEPIALQLTDRRSPGAELRIEVDRRFYNWGMRRTWRDRSNRSLDTQLNDVMIGLRALAVEHRQDRLRSEEIAHRIEAFHAERTELRERVESEQEALDALMEAAKAWQQAQFVRGYITAREAQSTNSEELTAWARWARAQADRLDPLTPSPPSVLDTPKEDYREYGMFDELPGDLFH